jgi:hypothetical protein
VLSAQPPHAVEQMNDSAHLDAELADDPASLSGA